MLDKIRKGKCVVKPKRQEGDDNNGEAAKRQRRRKLGIYGMVRTKNAGRKLSATSIVVGGIAPDKITTNGKWMQKRHKNGSHSHS